MKKDLIPYIDHIIESIDFIELILANYSKEDFIADSIRYEATLRKLQVMAESTQKLPSEIKNKYPNIKWKDISAFRNVLVHDYLGDINIDIIWLVITLYLPDLKITMQEIQKELESTSNKAEKK